MFLHIVDLFVCLGSHLALLLDGLFPCSLLLPALLFVTGLRGDARQVRVVDPRDSLRLLGGRASSRKDVQRDARLTGHTDGLCLRTDSRGQFSRLF